MKSLFHSKFKNMIFVIACAVFLFAGGLCLALLPAEGVSAAYIAVSFDCNKGYAYQDLFVRQGRGTPLMEARRWMHDDYYFSSVEALRDVDGYTVMETDVIEMDSDINCGYVMMENVFAYDPEKSYILHYELQTPYGVEIELDPSNYFEFALVNDYQDLEYAWMHGGYDQSGNPYNYSAVQGLYDTLYIPPQGMEYSEIDYNIEQLKQTLPEDYVWSSFSAEILQPSQEDTVNGGLQKDIDFLIFPRVYEYNEVKIVDLWFAEVSSYDEVITYETLNPIAPPTPYRKNAKFLGWYTQKEGGQQLTQKQLSETTPSDDITYYAHWNFEITLHRENGDETTDLIYWQDGQELAIDMRYYKPYKDGWHFAGYYSEPNGNGVKYINSDGSQATQYTGEHIDFYAHWLQYWTDDAQEPFGSGTSADPYIITSAQNLAWVADRCNKQGYTFDGEYIKQVADIDLVGKVWAPIGAAYVGFKGNYDGGYYKIENMMVEANVGGLFGWIYNAEDVLLENIRIESGEIRGENVGGIVGCAYGCEELVIENCINRANLYGTMSSGGILGSGQTIKNIQIRNCTNWGSIKVKLTDDTAGVGGIAGSVGLAAAGIGVCVDCNNFGDIDTTGGQAVGGIMGNSEIVTTTALLMFHGCLNFANISCDYAYAAGGILGYINDVYTIDIDFTKCSNIGDVVSASETYVGGIAGYIPYGSRLSFDNCYVYGTLIGGKTAGLLSHLNEDGGQGEASEYNPGTVVKGCMVNLKQSTISGGLLIGGLTYAKVTYSVAVVNQATILSGTPYLCSSATGANYTSDSIICKADDSLVYVDDGSSFDMSGFRQAGYKVPIPNGLVWFKEV